MSIKGNFSLIGLFSGLILFCLFLFTPPPEGLEKVAWLTAGIAVIMTVWWVTEALPIYATGLFPLIAFPLLDLYEIKIIASSYAHPLVLLFVGGFIIASCMESSGLHKRIALKILNFSGTSPSKIIGGFMLTTGLLSMWVSNTASTIMMLPIATSVIVIFNKQSKIKNNQFALPLLLAIAYSASIGGTATLIGTPTNIMLASILSENYNYQISFIDWLKIGLPVALILTPIVWIFLSKVIFTVSTKNSDALEKTIKKLKQEIGKPKITEKVVAFIFIFTAFLWIFRRAINDFFVINLNDTSIGLLGALLLFMIPTGKNKRACNWEIANRIPWGILFLVGGGIALSKAFQSSGLAIWIGSFSSNFYNLNIYFLVYLSVAVIIFLTELNSNTATVATFTPILIYFALGMNANPLYFVIPTTIAASCAFMLPIATPPNAVVFGSGKIEIYEMVKAGFSLNLISVITVTTISLIVLNALHDFRIQQLPDWIK